MQGVEHKKHECDCGHGDDAHVDRVTLRRNHSIGCRVCDMQDVFRPGFAGHEARQQEILDFLIDRLSLSAETADIEAAAGEAYLQLPAWKRQDFEYAWGNFLQSLARRSVKIVFADGEHRVGGEAISFHGEIDGSPVTHRVTRDAIHDQCDWQVHEPSPEPAFLRYREPLYEVVRRKIASGAERNEFGGMDITVDDIRRFGAGFDWKAGPAR
jgi:hypothetical protein